jgi:hypothetical protein
MAMVKKSVIEQAKYEARSIEDDIEENGCHQCHGELYPNNREFVKDEGIDKHFCDVKCQLAFYQEEYDRLITKNNAKVLYSEPYKEYRVIPEAFRWFIHIAFFSKGGYAIENDILSGDTEADVLRQLRIVITNLRNQ